MTKDEALDLALKTLRSVAGELYRVTSYCDTYDALAETNNAIMDISKPVQHLCRNAHRTAVLVIAVALNA